MRCSFIQYVNHMRDFIVRDRSIKPVQCAQVQAELYHMTLGTLRSYMSHLPSAASEQFDHWALCLLLTQCARDEEVREYARATLMRAWRTGARRDHYEFTKCLVTNSSYGHDAAWSLFRRSGDAIAAPGSNNTLRLGFSFLVSRLLPKSLKADGSSTGSILRDEDNFLITQAYHMPYDQGVLFDLAEFYYHQLDLCLDGVTGANAMHNGQQIMADGPQAARRKLAQAKMLIGESRFVAASLTLMDHDALNMPPSRVTDDLHLLHLHALYNGDLMP